MLGYVPPSKYSLLFDPAGAAVFRDIIPAG